MTETPAPEEEQPAAQEVETPEEKPAPQELQIEKGEATPAQIAEVEAGEYFTISYVANKLAYGYDWIRELVKQGRIKAIKPLGAGWRIPRSEIERLIKEGVPPLQRQQDKPAVTKIKVEDKKTLEKIAPTKQTEQKPSSGLGLDFFGLFPKK